MEYIKENQILLYEELCAKPVDEDDQIVKATILFRKNIKLANREALRFKASYDGVLDQEDILQSAYEGLWRSCLQFDSTKGYEFSTYAVPTIRGFILRQLRDNEAIKTPRVFKDIRSTLLSHGFTIPLSDEEVNILVEEGKFSRAQILEYSEPDMLYIDDYIKGDSDTLLRDIIPDTTIQDYCSTLSEDEIEIAINEILQYIKPTHRDIIEEWMYATLAGEGLIQSKIARKYGHSQSYISRIINASLSIIKMHKDEIREIFGY